MALRGQSVTTLVVSTTAATPTSILAASSTKTRYIRAIIPYNNDTVTRAWSLAFLPTTTTMTAANSEPFQESIPANTGRSLGPVVYPGRGRRLDNTAIFSFAAAASIIQIDVIYDESDTLDF